MEGLVNLHHQTHREEPSPCKDQDLEQAAFPFYLYSNSRPPSPTARWNIWTLHEQLRLLQSKKLLNIAVEFYGYKTNS